MRTIDANVDLLRSWKLPDLTGSEGKEDRGRVLVVGGSREIPGAALLAASASLRAGAGKLHIATAEDVATAVAVAMPEARVTGLATSSDGELSAVTNALISAARECDALLIGPGMKVSGAINRIVAPLVAHARAVVLDAGALDGVEFGAHVISPHFGEMAALCKCDKREVEADPMGIAVGVARERKVVVVLKSSITYVASPAGDSWIYRGGSIGLGTCGSGDVLAGLIAGLLAQGASAEQAAVWGVVLHGEAGAVLGETMGRLGYLARDIAEEIPRVRAVIEAQN